MIGPPRWASPYLRIPFKDHGRDDQGCDCWGLVRLVLLRERKIDLPLHTDVSPKRHLDIARRIRQEDTDSIWIKAPIVEAKPFDLALMDGIVAERNGDGSHGLIHIGIFVTPRHVLHTERFSGPACVTVDHPDVRTRLPKFVRRHHTLT